jgi:hypothetical protein
MVLTVSSALSLVTGLVCHHRRRDAKHHRRLDASVGASGPHGFAVRLSTVRYRHISVHRIPSRVRDDREPPLQWNETARDMQVIWVGREREYFLTEDWTTQITLMTLGFLSRSRRAIKGSCGPRRGRGLRERRQLSGRLRHCRCSPVLLPFCSVQGEHIERDKCPQAARLRSSASARYDKASARCSRPIFSEPSRSASVRATRSTR